MMNNYNEQIFNIDFQISNYIFVIKSFFKKNILI